MHAAGEPRGRGGDLDPEAYRLKKLEEQVNRHNQVIERTFRLEGRMTEVEHEIGDLKAYHKPS